MRSKFVYVDPPLHWSLDKIAFENHLGFLFSFY